MECFFLRNSSFSTLIEISLILKSMLRFDVFDTFLTDKSIKSLKKWTLSTINMTIEN